MNLIDCSYRRTDLGAVLESEDFRLNLPDETADIIEKQGLGEVILGIRPEHIELNKKKIREGLEAKCEMVEDYGNLRIVVLECAGKRIRVKSSITDIRVGEKIHIRLPNEYLRIFNKSGELVI